MPQFAPQQNGLFGTPTRPSSPGTSPGGRVAPALSPSRPSPPQELRSREEELLRAAQEQRFQEEQLRRREQELAEREMDIVERELHLLMCQLSQEKPRVHKRKGNFKRSRLLKLREGGSHISLPSGTRPRPFSSPERPLGAALTQGSSLPFISLLFKPFKIIITKYITTTENDPQKTV